MSGVPQTEWDKLVGGYPIEQEDRQYLSLNSTRPVFRSYGDLPERVDVRKHPEYGNGFLQTENQGSVGSCQGASLTENAEFCYTLATGKVIQFSKMFSYIVSQMADNIRTDSGSTLSGGTKAASQIGFCPQSIAPYPSRYPGWGYVTDAMKQAAAPNKLRSHTDLKQESEVKSYIGSGLGIVQIGIMWNGSMTPDANGCIRSWSAGGGGHAVVFCGYVPDTDVGQRSSAGYWYLLKNSWGTRWGKNGFAYVDPSAVRKMLTHRWTVMIGRSDMTAPKPRAVNVNWIQNSMQG